MPDNPHYGLTQAELQRDIGGAWDTPKVWGAIYSHRQACVRTIRDAMWHLLDDPKMTRRQFKRDMEALIKRIEERGP